MEFSPHELIETILQFRNPETANDARNQIMQFLTNPQSIGMLFDIILMPEIDDFIYQIAIICVNQFCDINKEIISEEMLDFLRSRLMDVLRSFRDSIPFSILLNAISTAIEYFSSDWVEIQEFAFEIDTSNIIYHIKLLSMLIPFFSDETISEKTDFFSELLSGIFQSDESNFPESTNNLEIQCSSVEFAVKLVERTQSHELIEQLCPLITKLLEVVISETNFNFDLLHQILKPIDDIILYKYPILDTQHAIKLAIDVMLDKSVPGEYKAQLNNLIEICVRDRELQISAESTRYILAIEFTLSIMLYHDEQEDEKFTWSYQIEDIVEYIFLRSTSQFIVNNVRNNFKMYYENENEGIRFFQLLLIKVLSKCYDIPNSEDLLIELYPCLFNFLSDPSPRFRAYTAITLGFISPRIKDYIIDNMISILEKVNNFVDEYRDEASTFLLLSLIECADNTDDFLEVEYRFIKEFLGYPNPSICMDVIDIIKLLISNSRSKLVLISNDAYLTLVKAISTDPSNYSGFLISISELISKDDDLNDYLSDFISMIKVGLDSGENDIINNSLSAAQNIINCFKEKNQEQTAFILSELLPPIKKIAFLPEYDNVVCKMKGLCIITIVNMLFVLEMNEELLSLYFECVDNYIEVPNDILTIYLTKSCFHLLFLINRTPSNSEMIINNENVQKDMSQLIIKIISSISLNEMNDETIDYYFVKFISMAIKLFGFERINVESNTVAEYLINKLILYSSYQNSHIFNESCMKLMKSICEALLVVLISDADLKSESQINQIFSKFLIDLLNDNLNQKGQIVAIRSFSLIFTNEKSRILFSEQFYQDIVQQINLFIAESNPIVSMSSCKFFYTILPSNFEILRPYALEVIKNLFQRLESTCDQNNQSISLREMIIVTICQFYTKYDGMIPTQQFLEAVLPCLPLTNKIKYSSNIYFLLSTLQNEIIKDENMTKQLFRIYVLVISDRNKESNQMDPPMLYLMAYFISQHSNLFQSEEEENEVIIQFFQEDEVAYHNFIQLYQIYLSGYNQMVNPNIDLNDIAVIDLTGQQFD